MDIPRPSNARAKMIRRIVLGSGAILLIGGVTYGLSRLRPAAPTVDRATVWSDEVKRGPMLRELRGIGTLIPEDIQWIPAQTEAQVDRIVLKPGAIVKSDSIILELSNLTLKRDVLDSEYQLKAAEADYANLKVQVNSELLNQKAAEAGVRSEYEQAKIQHAVDEKLAADGTKNTADAAQARLQAQMSHVDQQRALYELRHAELEALHVRAGLNGVLQLVPVEVGQHVLPGTNLARVADPKRLKAEIKVAETQAKDAVIGQKATIDTRNGMVAGHVSRIDPSVQNGTVTMDLAIDGPLPDGARPDLSVDGTIEVENLKDVLYVGRPVHGASQSTISLFKLTPDGSEATRVNVKLGRSSVNTVEILQGLQVGDRVILSDMSQWDNYDRVRLK